jgi:hypothetical protein
VNIHKAGRKNVRNPHINEKARTPPLSKRAGLSGTVMQNLHDDPAPGKGNGADNPGWYLKLVQNAHPADDQGGGADHQGGGGADDVNTWKIPEGTTGKKKLFQPKPFSEFNAAEAVKFLVCGLIARGLLTILSSGAKCGKTTLLAFLIKLFETGGEFCSLKVEPAKLLYLSEEPEPIWAERVAELGLSPDHQGQCLPFPAKPSLAQWQQFIGEVREYVEAEGIDLVILDTIANLAPVEDENDNSQVSNYMSPLRGLTSAGAAVLVLHHHGWGERRARGASALVGFVDVILDFYSPTPTDHAERKRVLSARGRVAGLIRSVTIELSKDGSGYELVSKDAPSAKKSTLSVMADIAPTEGDGWTIAEFLENWPGEKEPAEKTLANVAASALKKGLLIAVEKGSPGNPARYRKPDPPPEPTLADDHGGVSGGEECPPPDQNPGD